MAYQMIWETYSSPRRSYEFIDCSMPMTFDQYSNCWYSCFYCFASFQRSVNKVKLDYLQKKVKKVKLSKIINMIRDPDTHWGQFKDFIKNKMTMQRWGMSDPFCPIEEQEWTWYEIIKEFQKARIPIRFSSKSDLLLRNEKYFNLFKETPELFYYMSSIITLDEDLAKILEAWTPSPMKRIETLGKLQKAWVTTCLRLRPYIIWITDRTVKELVKKCAEAWVKHISTEFFCMEARASESVKANFKRISDLCWFDILEFYRKNTDTQWYWRLKRSVVQPYIDELIAEAKKYWMQVFISCPKNKHQWAWPSCCGLPENNPLFKFHKGQFTYALMLAKEKWRVERNDIGKHILYKNLQYVQATGINKANITNVWKYRWLTMYDYMRNLWNNTKSQNNPYRLFNWVLIPYWNDKDWNVIYKYNKNNLKDVETSRFKNLLQSNWGNVVENSCSVDSEDDKSNPFYEPYQNEKIC